MFWKEEDCPRLTLLMLCYRPLYGTSEGLVVRDEELGELGNGSIIHFGNAYTERYYCKTIHVVRRVWKVVTELAS